VNASEQQGKRKVEQKGWEVKKREENRGEAVSDNIKNIWSYKLWLLFSNNRLYVVA